MIWRKKPKARPKGQSSEHGTKVIRHTMEEPAWRALSSAVQALYPWLKLEWRGRDANNGGNIRLGVRQATGCLGVTHVTAAIRESHLIRARAA